MGKTRFMCIFIQNYVYKLNLMRTNIVIDDKLMKAALDLSGLPTMKSVIEEALKIYIQMLNQRALIQLGGKLKWEGDLDEIAQRLMTIVDSSVWIDHFQWQIYPRDHPPQRTPA